MPYESLAKLITEHKVVAEVRTALMTLEKVTQQTEKNCIVFSIKESQQQVGVFYLWEAWKDKQAFDQHLQQKHTQHYLSLGYTQVAEFHVLNSLSEVDDEY